MESVKNEIVNQAPEFPNGHKRVCTGDLKNSDKIEMWCWYCIEALAPTESCIFIYLFILFYFFQSHL